MKVEQNEKDKTTEEVNKALGKIFKIEDSNIIREIEELVEINDKVQKSIRHIIYGGCALIGLSVGVVIGIKTDGCEEQKPAFLGQAAFVIVSIVLYMLFYGGQLVERLKVKRALKKGLDMRMAVKIREIREEEERNGKEKK